VSAKPPVISSKRRFTSIPGFTDQQSFPRLGKIRLGVMAKASATSKEHPSEVDYFVFDPDQGITPDERQVLVERFNARYQARPQTIDNVIFFSSSREDIFSQDLEWWGSGKRLCHGDGVEAERLNRQTGQWAPRTICANTGQCAEWNTGKQCQMITRLRFMLPEISVAGYFQIDTGSKYSSANLRDCINILEKVFNRINGIPLTLARVPQQIEFEGKAMVHYIVHLRAPNVPIAAARQIAAERPLLALPAPDELIVEDEPDDLPQDLVPASEQSEPAAIDADVENDIEAGFALLGYSDGTRASLNAQYAKDRPGLLKHLRAVYKKRKAAGISAQAELPIEEAV